MKTILSLVLACFSVVIFAQNNATKSNAPVENQQGNKQKSNLTPEQRATRVIRMMSHKVNLTDAQNAALKPILNQREMEKEKIKSNSALEPKAKRASILEINAKYDEMIKKELTSEQWLKFEEFREEMKAKRAEKSNAKPQQDSMPDMEEGFY
jgi:Spy/CpxP family protein refolding chaperone